MDCSIYLRRNQLLRCLPEEEFVHLAADLTIVRNSKFDRAHVPGAPLGEVFFPLNAVFSVVEVLDGANGIEVTTIGNDGVVGLPFLLEAKTSVNTTLCHVPGLSARLGVSQLDEALRRGSALNLLFRHYTQIMIMQLARNAACNRVHLARQRASRWLLTIRDRVDRDRFPLTHKFLAQMLGVRRATVTVIAAELQRDGLIRYRRGQVEVLDHSGLEHEACECYRIVQERSGELLRTLTGGGVRDPGIGYRCPVHGR